MSAKLWTPDDCEPGERLWTPFRGKVRLQVGWPDNPGNPGEVCDTGFEHNAVLTYLPWILWNLLVPTAGTPFDRFYDGARVGPALGDVLSNCGSTSVILQYLRVGSTATAATSPIPSGMAAGEGAHTALLYNWLMACFAIGNYTGVAPAGAETHLNQEMWTTYSLIRSRNSFEIGPSGLPLFGAAATDPGVGVFYGPAVTAESITGISAPNPSTNVSRTFAPQSGTVNALAICPLFLAPAGASLSSLNPTNSAALPNYLVMQAGTAATSLTPASFSKALAVAGDPFSTVAGADIIASSFALLSAAVVVPGGANLTVTYAYSATL